MTLTAEGKISLTTAVYPLDAFDDAINDLDQGRLIGRGIPRSPSLPPLRNYQLRSRLLLLPS